MRLFITLLIATYWLPTLAQKIDTVHISTDIKLVQLSENLYQHITYTNISQWGRVPANGLIYVVNKKALMIDTPWNNQQSKELHLYLKKQGIELDHVIPTHWHEDCMGGLGYLQKQFVLSTAGERTYQIAHKKQLPVPFIRFKDTLNFSFNGKMVECFYPGGGHTGDNIVVYLPDEKVLFAGCLIKEATSTNLGNLSDADLPGWPQSIENVQKRFPNAMRVVPGHGAVGTLNLLSHTRQLLNKHSDK